MAALDEGDDELAETHFAAALDDEIDGSRARQQLDEIWMARARELEKESPERAADEYRRLLIRDPAAHHARMRLGSLLETRGDVDGAIYVLTQGPPCVQCKAQAAELQARRGRDKMRAGDFVSAYEDMRPAAENDRDPWIQLDAAQCFTAGGAGTAEEALAHLKTAYKELRGNAKLNTRWASLRRDFVHAASARQKWQAARDALAFEDPRAELDAATRAAETWTLTLDFAEAEQAAGNVDDGLAVGKDLWRTMQRSGLPVPAALRARVAMLYLGKLASLSNAGQNAAALVLAKEASDTHPDSRELRLFTALIVAQEEVAKGRALLETIQPVDTTWRRVEALLNLVEARKRISEGKLSAAERLIEQTRETHPDLLDLHLSYAEFLRHQRALGIGAKERKALQANPWVDYGGSPTRIGQAFAELMWVKGRFQEAREQREQLRLPGFSAAIARLETELRGILPYETRKLPSEAPRVVYENGSSSAVEIQATGPGVDETKSVAPQHPDAFAFEGPGVATIVTPQGTRTVVVEPWTAIVLK